MTFLSLKGVRKKPTLESVRRDLEAWREQRAKGSRIPAALWQEILDLMTPVNCEGVAAVLKIPARRLRKAAGFSCSDAYQEKSKEKASTSEGVPSLSFAEVPLFSWQGPVASKRPERLETTPPGLHTPQETAAPAILEMTRSNGLLVRVHGLEVDALARLLRHLD